MFPKNERKHEKIKVKCGKAWENIKKYEQDSVGEVIKNVKIKIDKKTQEIFVSTPYLFLGYLNKKGKLIKQYSQKLKRVTYA